MEQITGKGASGTFQVYIDLIKLYCFLKWSTFYIYCYTKIVLLLLFVFFLQLKRTGNQIQLKGNTLDDAIIAAITAMNEPKTCSTTTLRKHLLDANKDRKEHILGTTAYCTVLATLHYRNVF